MDLDDEKIRGKITASMRDNAIDEYLSKNYNAIVKPAINKMNLTDGRKIDKDEAIQSVRSRLMKQYFTDIR